MPPVPESLRTCAITGCSAGIGKAAAIAIATMGWRIIMLVRESDKSRAAFNEIRAASPDDIVPEYHLDLSSFDSIALAAEQMRTDGVQIDVMVNNAGVFKRAPAKSADGHEMTLAVNLLGPFLLTNLLLPLINNGPDSRIVNVTSEHYRKGQIDPITLARQPFNGSNAYADSKLALILFTRELSRRLQNRGITVNSVHPGVAGTDVFREYPNWFARLINTVVPGPASAASAVVHLATSSDVADTTGAYFSKSTVKPVRGSAEDDELARRVWELSARLTDLDRRREILWQSDTDTV